MSNIYITEPPTSGKVLLVTSVGDIDVELWSRETPLACRNFIQLCLEGYYNGTLFHRVVPNFIVQGGDPEGTGHGGSSVFDQAFKDEFHSRLRFVRRGLVAMANSGPNTNESQFFFTLAATPELNKKHTIFGKVAGDTIYNMLKLSDVDIDENERPIYPHKIISTQVLVNPFDDIVPRENILKQISEDGQKAAQSQSKATKNFKLLSFGAEAEDEEEDLVKVVKETKSKSKSSHDLLNDKLLSSASELDDGPIETMDSTSSSKAEVDSIKNKLKRPKEVVSDNLSGETKRKQAKWQENEAKQSSSSIIRHDKSNSPNEDEKDKNRTDNSSYKVGREKNKSKSSLLQSFPPKSKKSAADREAETLAILAKFKSRLGTVKETTDEMEDNLTDGPKDEDDFSGPSWMRNQFQCDEHNQRVKDANITELDRYEIFDPRNPMNQRRREESKKVMQEKKSKR